jgi:hypothetical protein
MLSTRSLVTDQVGGCFAGRRSADGVTRQVEDGLGAAEVRVSAAQRSSRARTAASSLRSVWLRRLSASRVFFGVSDGTRPATAWTTPRYQFEAKQGGERWAATSRNTCRPVSLRRLLDDWRDLVAEVESGYDQVIYEYTNDLYARIHLDEVLRDAPDATRWLPAERRRWTSVSGLRPAPRTLICRESAQTPPS